MVSEQAKAHRILDRIGSGEILISDGATGTYLQQHGLEAGGCPEEFNASHPDVVQGMARAYFSAGSDMVLTNSFGGSRFMQKKYGYEGRLREFNRLAAEHAASQKPSDAHFVAGSVGPTGEMMEPLPDGVSESDMYDALAEQMTALAEGGADAIWSRHRWRWRRQSPVSARRRRARVCRSLPLWCSTSAHAVSSR